MPTAKRRRQQARLNLGSNIGKGKVEIGNWTLENNGKQWNESDEPIESELDVHAFVTTDDCHDLI